MRERRPRGAGVAPALLLAGILIGLPPAVAEDDGSVTSPSTAAQGVPSGSAVPMHAAVSPTLPAPQLGTPLSYRGWIAVDPWVGVRWSAPDRDGNLVWGPVRTGRAPLRRRLGGGAPWPADSVWVEAPLQIFEVGQASIPGLGFRLESAAGILRSGNLPLVRLGLVSVIPASDSNASLRPPRGPLAAPWWERVAWPMVIAVALLVAAAIWLVRRLRRRKPAPQVAPRLAGKRRDPAVEALAELAALRRRQLPDAGHFAEHAFLLGRILRHYLEATVHVPRPGDTSPELIRHLETGGFSPEDLQRLTSLLRRWDGIKFARLESDSQEAERCEDAVRELVMRRSRPPKQEVA
ncbi:MAG: hypothetical protein ABIS67_06555 [Candidatus Eisenbacteria bacterium]